MHVMLPTDVNARKLIKSNEPSSAEMFFFYASVSILKIFKLLQLNLHAILLYMHIAPTDRCMTFADCRFFN